MRRKRDGELVDDDVTAPPRRDGIRMVEVLGAEARRHVIDVDERAMTTERSVSVHPQVHAESLAAAVRLGNVPSDDIDRALAEHRVRRTDAGRNVGANERVERAVAALTRRES